MLTRARMRTGGWLTLAAGCCLLVANVARAIDPGPEAATDQPSVTANMASGAELGDAPMPQSSRRQFRFSVRTPRTGSPRSVTARFIGDREEAPEDNASAQSTSAESESSQTPAGQEPAETSACQDPAACQAPAACGEGRDGRLNLSQLFSKGKPANGRLCLTVDPRVIVDAEEPALDTVPVSPLSGNDVTESEATVEAVLEIMEKMDPSFVEGARSSHERQAPRETVSKPSRELLKKYLTALADEHHEDEARAQAEMAARRAREAAEMEADQRASLASYEDTHVRQVDVLRDVAASMDSSANALERANLCGQADELRSHAQELRQQARRLASRETTADGISADTHIQAQGDVCLTTADGQYQLQANALRLRLEPSACNVGAACVMPQASCPMDGDCANACCAEGCCAEDCCAEDCIFERIGVDFDFDVESTPSNGGPQALFESAPMGQGPMVLKRLPFIGRTFQVRTDEGQDMEAGMRILSRIPYISRLFKPAHAIRHEAVPCEAACQQCPHCGQAVAGLPRAVFVPRAMEHPSMAAESFTILGSYEGQSCPSAEVGNVIVLRAVSQACGDSAGCNCESCADTCCGHCQAATAERCVNAVYLTPDGTAIRFQAGPHACSSFVNVAAGCKAGDCNAECCHAENCCESESCCEEAAGCKSCTNEKCCTEECCTEECCEENCCEDECCSEDECSEECDAEKCDSEECCEQECADEACEETKSAQAGDDQATTAEEVLAYEHFAIGAAARRNGDLFRLRVSFGGDETVTYRIPATSKGPSPLTILWNAFDWGGMTLDKQALQALGQKMVPTVEEVEVARRASNRNVLR